jgi:hypothetical protein
VRRLNWGVNRNPAVALPGPDHPNTRLVTALILNCAKMGRAALARNWPSEAKYYRDLCSQLIWRLAVDGTTCDGQLRWDGAKYETRLRGRLSSEAARKIRESPEFVRAVQGALENRVACDHVVPRNCVAEALIRPDWFDLEDEEAVQTFLVAHAGIAVLSPEENFRLDRLGLTSRMPVCWWDASAADKPRHVFARYEAAGIVVSRTP